MDRRTDGGKDKRTDGPTNRQTDELTDRPTDIRTDGMTNRQTGLRELDDPWYKNCQTVNIIADHVWPFIMTLCRIQM